MSIHFVGAARTCHRTRNRIVQQQVRVSLTQKAKQKAHCYIRYKEQEIILCRRGKSGAYQDRSHLYKTTYHLLTIHAFVKVESIHGFVLTIASFKVIERKKRGQDLTFLEAKEPAADEGADCSYDQAVR